MSDQFRELTREELYELVWSEPISHIAARFSVFEAAVVKWCKELNVPKPPPSHWARARLGLKVSRKPPLPPSKDDEGLPLLVFVDDAAPPTDSSPPLSEAERVIRRIEREKQAKEEAWKAKEVTRNKLIIEFRNLHLQAKGWEAANRVRAYLDAVEGSNRRGELEVRNEKKFRDWLSSSRQLADELDPITGGWGEAPPGFVRALGPDFYSIGSDSDTWLWSKKTKRRRK